MRKIIATVITVLATCIILHVNNAPADGEVFKIETSGTEYCDDFSYYKFGFYNNIDLWLYIGYDEFKVSFTPYFETESTFPVTGRNYLINAVKRAFVGGVLFDDYSFASVQGTITYDKYGFAKSVQGSFIQDSIMHYGCFSSGKFKSVQRLY